MFQKDYILRMIEQFVKVLARILHLKEQKEYPQAIQEIGDAYRLFFGLSAEMIDLMSDADLLRFLRARGDMDGQKYAALGTLLKEEAEILNLQNQESEAHSKADKAVSIFLEALSSYESEQKYDRAENLLFDLVEWSPAFRQYGIAFYARLLKKSDRQLESGGLPRTEVEEGLAAFKKNPC